MASAPRPKRRIRRTITKMKKGPKITGAPQAQVERRKEYIRTRRDPKYTKRAAKKVMRKEKGMLSTAVSLRHRRFLVDPDRPFAESIGAEARIKSGLGLGSTAIVTFEYFEERRMLVLHWWKNWKKQIPGAKYAYFDVPIWKYDRLVRASSKGRYIYYNIRTSHPFRRLTK